jgi:hypothetical protein
MDITDLLTKTLDSGFQKHKRPTNFLQKFSQEKLFETSEVIIPSQVIANIQAVDTSKLGAHRVDFGKFGTDRYTLPAYNQYSYITPEMLEKVQFAKTEYQLADLSNTLVENTIIMQEQIENAIEKQIVDAIFNNQVILEDQTKIGYKRKTTHINTTYNWSLGTNNPINDISDGCKLIIQDSKISASNTFNLILSNSLCNILLANENFRKNSNFVEGRELTKIVEPKLAQGATYHGTFSAGSFNINLWSYLGTYQIPKGFGIANEGQTVQFIPEGNGILLGEGMDFRTLFGGLDNSIELFNSSSQSISNFRLRKGKFQTYVYWDIHSVGSASLIYGVKSRPLFVPVDNDAFYVFKAN